MNNRAQAGLEYLMTYGWALVLIATVVGVLVFVVDTPAEGFKCTISDPTKIMLKGYSVPAAAYLQLPQEPPHNGADFWCSGGGNIPFSCEELFGTVSGTNKIVLQNLTGGSISIYDAKCFNPPGWEIAAV